MHSTFSACLGLLQTTKINSDLPDFLVIQSLGGKQFIKIGWFKNLSCKTYFAFGGINNLRIHVSCFLFYLIFKDSETKLFLFSNNR
jgi:hypothetical protein